MRDEHHQQVAKEGALDVSRGPGPDIKHAERLIVRAWKHADIKTVLADAGYDAEWMHELSLRIRAMWDAPPGGVATSSYQLVINDTAVDLGDSKTPADRPSFKNTLSAGDRTTLALAFFLAHLERDPAATGKLVVFDDPFSSQDAFLQKILWNIGPNIRDMQLLNHFGNVDIFRRYIITTIFFAEN